MTRAKPLVLLYGLQGEAFPLAVGDDITVEIVTRVGRDEHPWLAQFTNEQSPVRKDYPANHFHPTPLNEGETAEFVAAGQLTPKKAN